MYESITSYLNEIEIVDINVEERIIEIIKIIHMKTDYQKQIDKIVELMENR